MPVRSSVTQRSSTVHGGGSCWLLCATSSTSTLTYVDRTSLSEQTMLVSGTSQPLKIFQPSFIDGLWQWKNTYTKYRCGWSRNDCRADGLWWNTWRMICTLLIKSPVIRSPEYKNKEEILRQESSSYPLQGRRCCVALWFYNKDAWSEEACWSMGRSLVLDVLSDVNFRVIDKPDSKGRVIARTFCWLNGFSRESNLSWVKWKWKIYENWTSRKAVGGIDGDVTRLPGVCDSAAPVTLPDEKQLAALLFVKYPKK